MGFTNYIQQIKDSGGTTHDLVDTSASHYIKGTQSSSTNAWTGALPDGVTAYYDGLAIDYFLPYAGTSTAATLNLGSKGAKPVYVGNGNSAVTTHFPQYSVIHLTYIINSGLNSGNGCWKATSYYDTNTSTWSGISGKPTTTGSKTTGITASTTATKTTLGTAFSIPNVTNAGSASTWTFEEKTIPNVTSAGSASTWAFTGVTVANSISGAVDSSDNTQLNITLGTTTVQSKSSGANGSAPTLGTAIKVQSKSGGANGSAPTLGTAFSVPNVTGNTSATVSITDNGHTHSIS